MSLSGLQRQLAASLVAAAAPPAGCDAGSLARAARALAAKRRAAAAQLLPRTHRALGAAWAKTFAAHSASYRPEGLLYHVDDAWALALALRRHGEAAVSTAAREDLLAMRLRWVRDAAQPVHRIRPRTGPLLAWAPHLRAVVIRPPGTRPRAWWLRLPARR